MKKILLSVVCLMMVGIQSVMAQTPAAIMLMHQGQATMYTSQQLTTAVTAAEAGDTIFLSNGTYSVQTGLTIDKPISLIGAGQGTIVSGDIIVDIDSAATVTGRLLDGIKFSHSIIFNQSPDGIIIRKCWVSVNFQLTKGCGNVQLDRSYVRYYSSSEFQHSFAANNSVVSQYKNGYTGNIIFTNCNLGSFYKENTGYQFNGNSTFINCIIGDLANSHSSNTYINCISNEIYTNDTSYGTFDNCTAIHVPYNSTGENILSFDNNNGFPTPRIEYDSYKGTDGTVVGVEGGSTPYTLTPSLPTISESSFTVDDSNRILNVTLKVTAE